ncbi:MAG: MmcQ/YjbR family DNA-binding protein [Bacteroidetes bacterium]|jgi:predicted DNA-binding protein (MmcQ/YjbR family)|nr:MmcQ/YjbR family DNA-binding protein [Bacteroidota bacterium]
MNIEEFRDFCLSFNGVTEEFPFDENTLVFKVMGKMFALCDVDEFESINLKCNPSIAVQLREEFPGIVIPGYHMNKRHWNTIIMENNIPDQTIQKWISNSYDLVVANLPKKDRMKLHSGD